MFCLACPSPVPAQETSGIPPTAPVDSPYAVPPGQMALPLSPGGDGMHGLRSPSRPVMILPMPVYADTMSGTHGPGSYVPRDTPLHRFNGYVVCNPPPPSTGNTAASETAGTAERPKRVVKITSTRSPAAPGYLQPCPVYTLDGQLPSQHGAAIQGEAATPNKP